MLAGWRATLPGLLNRRASRHFSASTGSLHSNILLFGLLAFGIWCYEWNRSVAFECCLVLLYSSLAAELSLWPALDTSCNTKQCWSEQTGRLCIDQLQLGFDLKPNLASTRTRPGPDRASQHDEHTLQQLGVDHLRKTLVHWPVSVVSFYLPLYCPLIIRMVGFPAFPQFASLPCSTARSKASKQCSNDLLLGQKRSCLFFWELCSFSLFSSLYSQPFVVAFRCDRDWSDRSHAKPCA